MKENEHGDGEFRLRIYGKSELAALGHDKHRKFFLKPEVEVIVRGLGEP